MDHDSSPLPAHELRILVLHNRDFGGDSGRDHHAGTAEDGGHAARADVVNAAQDVARALAARGHFVEVQGTDSDDIGPLLGRLSEDRPDLVFNLCESLSGDSRNEVVLPVLLDMLRLPYTGTGHLGIALSLHKDRAKEVLRSAGVPTPRWATLPEAPGEGAGEDLALVAAAGLRFPLIVKPSREDASVGISAASVVRDGEALRRQLAALRAQYRQPILCEEYIAGREIYVSLLGNGPAQALPLTEIDFSGLPGGRPRIVCYEAKWQPGSIADLGTRSGPAAPLDGAVEERIVAAAQAAFAALGLRDYGRCDLRVAEDGTPYVIDVNPNCDLSDGAGYSRAARAAGLSYDALIEQIALAALSRRRGERAEAPLKDEARQGLGRGRGDGRPALAGREQRPGAARSPRQRAV